MKTIPPGFYWMRWPLNLPLAAGLLLGLVPCGGKDRNEAADKGPPGEAAAAASAAGKTHSLFMGVDFDIEQNKQYYRARDVSGSAFVVRIDRREVLVPMDRGPVNMKVVQQLKLAEGAAVVVDLQGERAYTSANDPQRKIIEAQMAATVAQPTSADMTQKMGNQVAYATQFLRGDEQRQAIERAQGDMNTSMSTGAALTSTATNLSGQWQGDLAKEMYDAMEITFRVSSPRLLTSPYVVITAQYREINEKPGTVHNWIYAKELDTIDNLPRRVHILQGGLPPGFVLEKFQLHLYDHGRELASNVADKLVPLTRDEAFEYIMIDYLGSHKGATVSTPAPAMGRPSPEARSRLTGDQLQQNFYVKVTKDGLAEAAYLDDACSMAVADPAVESLIKEVRFKPALEEGKPVEGVARLKLNDLTL